MGEISAIDALFWFGLGALATAIGAGLALLLLAWRLVGPRSRDWRRTWTGRCRECGCGDLSACTGADGLPCYWIEPDLCSNCAAAEPSPSTGEGRVRVGRRAASSGGQS